VIHEVPAPREAASMLSSLRYLQICIYEYTTSTLLPSDHWNQALNIPR
jgi:hypothetical protein